MPSPENGITVHHKGETFLLDLSEKEADQFRTFVCYASDVPAELPGPYPQERADTRAHMRESFTKDATLGEIGKQLADLNQHDLVTVNALIAVINAGHSIAETGGNWIYEVITDLLFEVSMEGPFQANDQDPRSALADIAGAVAMFWSWVENARDLKERHPRLFPAPPVEPEAPAEPSTTSTPAKPGRARKTRRKAA